MDHLHIEKLRVDIAQACRVMAHRGLVDDILGHISARIGPDRILVRCRGGAEQGLRFTEPDDVCEVDLGSGAIVGGASASYTPPSELPIHTALYRHDPTCQAVVHAHPRSVVIASLADVEPVPPIGAYNIPAARLAAEGIAIHPRAVLIRDHDLATEMVASMSDRPVAILRGHGLVTTGSSVAQAVLRALDVNTLCELSLGVLAAGHTPHPITDRDLAALPDLGAGFNETTLWRYHLAALAADGRALENR